MTVNTNSAKTKYVKTISSLNDDEFLDLAIAAGRLGTWTLNLRQKQLAGSTTFRDLAGLSGTSTVAFTQFFAGVHVDDTEPLKTAIQTCAEFNEPFCIQFRIFPAAGKLRWLEMRGRRPRLSKGGVLNGVVRDISAERFSLHEKENARREITDVLSVSGVPTAIFDPHDLLLSYSNGAFDQTFARAADSLSLDQIFPPYDAVRLRAQMRDVIENKKRVSVPDLKLKITVEGGASYTSAIELTLLPCGTEEDDLRGVYAIFKPVAANAHAGAQASKTDELEFQSQKLDAVFQESPATMALFRGEDLVFEKFNSKYQALCPGRDLIGRSFTEVFPSDVAQPFLQQMKKVLKTGQAFVGHEIQTMVPDPDTGEKVEKFFDYTFVRVHSPEGSPYGVHSHGIDVTDRVLANRSLKTSQEKLSLALETGKIGFFDRDLINDRVTFSERMKKDWDLHGASALKDDDIVWLVHPDDQLERLNQIQHAIDSHGPYHNEYRVRMTSGEYRWMESRGHVEYDEAGKAIRLFGTSVDITERKRDALALQIAKDRAEKANRTKSDFLANMSHELRTPLGAIIGFTDLLHDPVLPKEEHERFINTISRTSKALARIIDDILDLSKVEAGRLRTEIKPINFRSVLNEAHDLFRESAKAKKLAFNLEIAEDIPECIKSDSCRLRQIMVNLIGNAIKFTDQGHIRVVARLEEQMQAPHQLRIDVIDTGIGISEDEIGKLFIPFSQADNSSQRRHGGTGLGLALSRRLANALSGDVTFSSAEPAGSIFTLRLPYEEVVTPVPTLPAVAPPNLTLLSNHLLLKGVKILLAEDSEDNQFLVNRLLTKYGATVTVVSNGHQAVDEANSGHYDVILMDIQMPGMDGNEATRILRKSGYRKSIVALTAHAMAEEKDKSLTAGCDRHLTKPLNVNDLLETIINAGARLH